MEIAAKLGVFKCGFVSLMPCNEKSMEEFINFNDIFKNEPKQFMTIAKTNDFDICECRNGVYLTNTGKIIRYYACMMKDLNCPYARQYVYTSDNHLKAGFDGTTLI